MKALLMPRSPRMIATLVTLVSVITTVAPTLPAIAAEPTLEPRSPSPTLQAQNSIPPATVEILRQDLSRRTGIPANQLRFVAVSPQTFPNGCLGLAGANEMCTQMMVSGWRVTFAHQNQRWVYRTNANGTNFRLESGSQAQQPHIPQPVSVQPSRIPLAELPPPLPQEAVFRAIASGGFAGRTYQTTLYRDGRLVREELRLGDRPTSSQVRQLPRPAVQQFLTLLRQTQMHRLNRAHFLPQPGSADFITTTLSCQFCTVRYADSIQADLPSNLQTVIQVWNRLSQI